MSFGTEVRMPGNNRAMMVDWWGNVGWNAIAQATLFASISIMRYLNRVVITCGVTVGWNIRAI